MKYGQINLTVNCENDGKHKRRNGIKSEFFFHSTSKMVLHTRTHLNASELKYDQCKKVKKKLVKKVKKNL